MLAVSVARFSRVIVLVRLLLTRTGMTTTIVSPGAMVVMETRAECCVFETEPLVVVTF